MGAKEKKCTDKLKLLASMKILVLSFKHHRFMTDTVLGAEFKRLSTWFAHLTVKKSPYWPFYYEAKPATMKMTSAKSRRSPYPRNRTKSGTARISEVDKLIMDLEPRMSDIVLATPIEKLKVISDMTIATNQQIIREETIDIRQYEEELETQVISVRSHSLDCHDDSYKQMKFGPPLTEDRMFWVDRINIGQNL